MTGALRHRPGPGVGAVDLTVDVAMRRAERAAGRTPSGSTWAAGRVPTSDATRTLDGQVAPGPGRASLDGTAPRGPAGAAATGRAGAAVAEPRHR